eukprot:2885641-Prymnesium_polylepis.1
MRRAGHTIRASDRASTLARNKMHEKKDHRISPRSSTPGVRHAAGCAIIPTRRQPGHQRARVGQRCASTAVRRPHLEAL